MRENKKNWKECSIQLLPKCIKEQEQELDVELNTVSKQMVPPQMQTKLIDF